MSQQFEIDIAQFKILNKLHTGRVSSIFSVQDVKTNETYAAKTYENIGSSSKESIIQEINIINRIEHPTLVKYYGFSFKDFYGKDNFTLIMQYSPQGSLFDLLSKIREGQQSFCNTARQKILIGIAHGMKYLHQNQIVHRDLKPENILLDKNFEPSIKDFGFSKFLNIDDSNSLINIAPEVIENQQYSYKSDVYSFGILMYEIIENLILFHDINSDKLKSKILNENYRPQFTTATNPKIQKLIEQCWSKDPKERSTFDDIYNKLSRNAKNGLNGQEDFPFYLDDVDSKEILSYVNKIESDEKSSTVTNEEQTKIRLHVKINEAKDLIPISTKFNPLITIHLKNQPDQSEESTDYKSSTTNPVWNEEFDLFTTDKNDILIINLFNFKNNEDDESDDDDDDDDCYEKIMDEIQYPINSLIVGGPLVKEELEITLNKKKVGILCFEVQCFKTEIEPFCTFSATGDKYIKQKLYDCLTCNLTLENGMGICEACAKKCHKDHDIRFVSVKPLFYCDCPAKCKCCCMPKTSDLICTSIENHNSPINQPMFYCKDCDSSCKFFICQNCAAKFHHGHDLIYLGIVEAKVCQNDQINDINI